MTFDEAWKENRHVCESSKDLAYKMYIAGKKSSQLEVSDLTKLNERLKKSMITAEDNRREWRDSYIEARNREDDLKKRMDEVARIVHEAHMSDGNSSVEIVYELIQEVLK